MAYEIIDAPEELEQLIIYEIATKGFTSPNGPESGTFVSMEERIPYLKELGINAIWLTGHQMCNSNHFYNIWTEYAVIRPDRLDSSLGTEEEFRHLIQTAHAHGIMVFLDVITHGVIEDSPLIEEHPDWFSGGTWEMRDFDWYGGHKDLDEWWVNLWLWYVEEFGIDGYRLDVAHYRNDLWALVRKKAAQKGKKLVIIAETGPAIRGVTDILQHGEWVSNGKYGTNDSSRILTDAAGYFRDTQLRKNERYGVKIFYTDGTVQNSVSCGWSPDEKVLEVIKEAAVIERIECEEQEVAYQQQTNILRVENIYTQKEIRNIQITDLEDFVWNSNMEGMMGADCWVKYKREKNHLQVEFPLRVQKGQLMSVQLSCHDNGWEDYPLDENPYGAQGSRYLAGYGAILAPAVPVFMAGEEFDADYRPLPGLSPKLYGGENPGKGRWLYGSWLDWEQLKRPEKAQMLEDMKRIIHIRRSNFDLIRPCRMEDEECGYKAVWYEASKELPLPYCYGKDKTVILIAANPYTDEDVSVKFDFGEILDAEAIWQVDLLFGIENGNGGELKGTSKELSNRSFVIKRDKTSQGGLLVLKLQLLDEFQ